MSYRWTVRTSKGRTFGPLSKPELMRLLHEGEISLNDETKSEQTGKVRRIRDILTPVERRSAKLRSSKDRRSAFRCPSCGELRWMIYPVCPVCDNKANYMDYSGCAAVAGALIGIVLGIVVGMFWEELLWPQFVLGLIGGLGGMIAGVLLCDAYLLCAWPPTSPAKPLRKLLAKPPTCEYCGGILKPDERHCPNCGAPVEQANRDRILPQGKFTDNHELTPVFRDELLEWLRHRRRVKFGELRERFNLSPLDEVRTMALLEREGILGRTQDDETRAVRIGPRPRPQRGGR